MGGGVPMYEDRLVEHLVSVLGLRATLLQSHARLASFGRACSRRLKMHTDPLFSNFLLKPPPGVCMIFLHPHYSERSEKLN